jgi:hypothetical protein
MLPLLTLNSVKKRGSNGALRSHLFAKGEPAVVGRAVAFRKSSPDRAENSHRQGPEVCPSRQACDFEAVTGLTLRAQQPRADIAEPRTAGKPHRFVKFAAQNA